jgi:hypothetical protein
MLSAALDAHRSGAPVLVVASDHRQVDSMCACLSAMGAPAAAQPKIVAVDQVIGTVLGRFFEDVFFDHRAFESDAPSRSQVFSAWDACRARTRRIHG